MDILGVSCFYHDSAAALFRDGQLVACAEEERFSRKKHDFDFPRLAIEFVLKKGGIRGTDLDYVVFYEKPFVKFERILMSVFQTFPKSYKVFREAMVTWLLDKLWIKNYFRENLGLEEKKILFSEHHLAHAASAFLCSPYQDAAILTVDGVGEWATATLGVGRGTEVRILKEIHFPHSLGLLYSAFTAFLGFEVNEGEYKVMGMAPYGKPAYTDKVKKLISINTDGSFQLNMDYFSYHYSTEKTFNSRFEFLFGDPRSPSIPFFTADTPYPSYYGAKPGNFNDLARKNQYYADIAASIQVVIEEAILALANTLYKETGLRKLCVAGGVGLNGVANWRLLKETPFEEIYIQPAAGDSGGAIGAALYAYHTLFGRPRSFRMEHVFWGEEYSEAEIEDFLRSQGIKSEKMESEETIIARTVDLLKKGKVVGWFQGKFEWGPRALGHRSILADPREEYMKDVVNTKIKFREPFRPFAPSVIVEKAKEFFYIEDPERHYPARFMLYVVPVKDGKKSIIPAVTHVDGTSRLQIVTKDHNTLYYHLISAFGGATGVPVLLNTSFNLRGEPIVNTPQNAFSTFMRSEMDALVLGRWIVTKEP